jgi:predicted Zn-dependent peptidase
MATILDLRAALLGRKPCPADEIWVGDSDLIIVPKSKILQADNFIELVFTKGGSMNGTTSNDRTLYFEIMPKNQLDLVLFLEADRMKSLNVTKENLENQRQAVKEERRLGVDNQPYGQAYEKMDELVYDNFAYKHSVIGSMALSKSFSSP